MIDVAIGAAKQAGELALKYFKTQPKVSYKADKSPVTKADIEVEKLIRRIIGSKFPNHGIIGEEFGQSKPNAKYKWVIDPIDGTRLFIRGIPLWSVLIAVLKDNNPIIGINFSPAIGEFALAEKNKGAFLNDKRIHVSKISDIKLSFLGHGSVKRFSEIKMLKKFLKVAEKIQSIRGYSDSYALNLLASGKIDIYLEPRAAIHDLAAPAIIVKEAGGKFTDFSGKFSITSGNAVATNGLLHDQVLKILNS